MQKVTYETPSLYGDHHVTEVRRILLEVPGVVDVYASSAFQIIEVTYDPDKINDLEIAVKLDAAGYLGEWTAPIESGAAAYHADDRFKALFSPYRCIRTNPFIGKLCTKCILPRTASMALPWDGYYF